jgi:Tol biopolymer transport system component
MSFFAPLPSPDGKKLFVVGVQARGELVRYDARSHEFVPYLSGISAEHLDFSRDGEWIAYIAYPEGTLWRRKVDGSERLQLTFPPMQAVLPRWSPDGKQIAFMASLPGKPVKIYLVSAEGGSPQQLMPGYRSEQDPSWSPDGNSLAFGGSWRSEAKETLAVEILDLKTHQVSTPPGSRGHSAPLWSPDGRYIAATENHGRLALFDSTAQNWMDLTSSCGFYKIWSRDGKHLYFDGPCADERGIFRVGIGDRKVERVASLKEFSQVYGTAGTWFGLAPDDSPLLLRSVSTQEVYAIDWEAP